jgi:hypothetical protein
MSQLCPIKTVVKLGNIKIIRHLITGKRYPELLLFGMCPSSCNQKNYKTQGFGNWISFRPNVKEETTTLLGPLERANVNHWPTYVRFITAIYIPETQAMSKGDNRKICNKNCNKACTFVEPG